MHTPIIQQAVFKMQQPPYKKEYEVGRVILTILRKYFTIEDNWAITPEFRVPEKKKGQIFALKNLHLIKI